MSLIDSLPEITVILDPVIGTTGRYELDVLALRRRQPFRGATHADLIIQFRDRPGGIFVGGLSTHPKMS